MSKTAYALVSTQLKLTLGRPNYGWQRRDITESTEGDVSSPDRESSWETSKTGLDFMKLRGLGDFPISELERGSFFKRSPLGSQESTPDLEKKAIKVVTESMKRTARSQRFWKGSLQVGGCCRAMSRL